MAGILWGGEETAPFQRMSNLKRLQTKSSTSVMMLTLNFWKVAGSALDEEEIVNQQERDFTEGLLQGWGVSRDDWETLMSEDSEDNALLGGVILSMSMLYDPETAITTLAQQGIEGLEQFEEIFNALPVMLCGLTQRGVTLAESQ
jgi:uncharacterized protein